MSLELKARIFVQGSGKKERMLEAVLATRDLSMTGVFFESTFFLKVGSVVRVEFTLPSDNRLIRVMGSIVREERAERTQTPKGVRSGFAVHFSEFVDDSAVVLASLFLAPRVREFVTDYLSVRRKDTRSENDRLVDVVVAWELGKTDPSNIWTG